MTSQTSCTTLFQFTRLGYDKKSLNIESHNLFNQQITPSNLAPWKGDWPLRRLRLTKFDSHFRESKPHLIFFRELMSKQSGQFDSDEMILSAGSLAEYNWKTIQINEFPESAEDEKMGVAYNGALTQKSNEPEINLWENKGTTIVQNTLQFDGEDLYLFHLKSNTAFHPKALDFLSKHLTTFFSSGQRCSERVVIALSISELDHEAYSSFLKKHNLKDSATGFCDNLENCYTHTTNNALFRRLYQNTTPEHTDRLIAHQSALIQDSSNIQISPLSIQHHLIKQYAMENSPVSPYWGWRTRVRLSKCERREL